MARTTSPTGLASASALAAFARTRGWSALARATGPSSGRAALVTLMSRSDVGSTACTAATVTQELAGRGARALALVEGDLAVDEDRLVALGPLHPAPLATGQVVGDLADPLGLHVELFHVVDDDVGRRAFAQHATVAEPGRMRGQRRHAEVGVLEGDLALVPHQPAQHVGRPGAAGEELGVGAAVGD